MNKSIDPRTLNIFGAFGLLLADRVFTAVGGGGELGRQESVALIQIGLFSPAFANLQTTLRLTQSATSRLVGRLAARGLVAKQARPDDPRGKRLRLTRRGEEMMQAMLAARQAALQELFAALGEDEAATLLDLVSKILAANIRDEEESGTVCRMCDLGKCPQERCPVRRAPQGGFVEPDSKRLPTHLL